MDGVTWVFLVLLISLIALGVIAGLRRKRLGVNPPRHCSSCTTPMSLRRVSLLQLLTSRGEWMCPHCGTRIRGARRATGTAA